MTTKTSKICFTRYYFLSHSQCNPNCLVHSVCLRTFSILSYTLSVVTLISNKLVVPSYVKLCQSVGSNQQKKKSFKSKKKKVTELIAKVGPGNNRHPIWVTSWVINLMKRSLIFPNLFINTHLMATIITHSWSYVMQFLRSVIKEDSCCLRECLLGNYAILLNN